MVLGFGEMLPEDQPDDAIWLDEEELTAHFKALKAKREADPSGSGENEYEENEAATQLLARIG